MSQQYTRKERLQLLALRAPSAMAEARVVLMHLRALGVNVGAIEGILDLAQQGITEAAAEVLTGVPADTVEQERGRQR